MAWSFIAADGAGSSDTSSVVTPAISSNGADTLLAFTCDFTNVAPSVLLDSSGNTWNLDQKFNDSAGSQTYISVYRATGTIITSATHTFSYTNAATYPSAILLALSGGDGGTFDVVNTGSGGGSNITTLSTGSVTPNQASSLVLSVLALDAGSGTATSPMTLAKSVAFSSLLHFGLSVSYEIQTTATARNPNWTFGSTRAGGLSIVYKPATGIVVNVSGTNVTSAAAAIASSSAETKAVPGIGIAASPGTVIATAGGSISLTGAAVSGSPGTIGVTFSARTVSLAGGLTGATAGTITTNGSAPALPRSGLLTRRDWTQEPGVVFSGGNWWTGFAPLASLSPDVPICAISRVPADTTFDCDLGTTRSIEVIHFQRLRISWASRMRVRVGNDPAFGTTTYDSGIVSGWPASQAQFATRPFGDWSFAGLVEPEEAGALGFPRWFLPSTAVSARYARVEIWDRVAAFPPQIGAFGMCEAWELPVGPSVGFSVQTMGGATTVTAQYGSRYLSGYPTKRRINLGFDAISHADFVERIIAVLPRAGVSVPAAMVVNPDTIGDAWPERIGVYGLLAQADVAAAHYGLFSFPLTLDQL